MSNLFAVRVVAVTLLGALTACSSGSGAVGGVDLSGHHFEDRRHRPQVTVEAVDNDFRPLYVTVSPGTRVTFENVGRNRHDVIPIDHRFRQIGPNAFEPGDRATVAFARPGDYPYYCSLHGTPTKGMRGAIRVTG